MYLHLWNTWIDNESSQNWGGGLWEQRYIYYFPFSLFVSVYVYASLCEYSFAFNICPRVLSVLFFFFFSIVFSACYHWWICFLVGCSLLSFFLLFFNFFIFNNYFFITLFYFISLFLFFLPFLLSCVADRVLVLWLCVRPLPLRWESWVQDIGLPETCRLHVISNSKSSLRDLNLNNKTQLHSETSKLQCWTPMPNN